MKKAARIGVSALATLVISLIVSVDGVLAGPPLLCHAIEIGEAKSLPWGGGAWQSDKIDLKDDAFVARTLELLSPDVAVLTRMETIRRATIHAAERPKAADALLSGIHARVAKMNAAKEPDAIILFDLGYFMACYIQMNIVTDHNSTGYSGKERKALAVPDEPRPYELVKKSASLSPADASIEFALALLTSYPTHAAHKTHLQNAVAGATEGSFLATNLVQHFGRQGQTLTDLRTSFGIAANGERR